jgi:hypothetical protein
MAVFNGTSMLIIVDGITIAASTEFTLTIDSNNPEKSSKDSAGWTNRLYGKRDWNVSHSGFADPAAVFSVEEIFDIIDTRDRVFLEMAVIDGLGGGLKFSGYALAKNLTLGAGNETPVTCNASFEADGPIDKGTVHSS